jgi:threonine dehydratase
MKSSNDFAANIDDVKLAANRIRRHIHRTPVLTSETLSEMAGCHLFFKCENFQKSGSFKIRGAMNAVAQLTNEELAKGVVTHSSGNHAGALALAAKTFGTQAHIVMPSNSSEVKKAAVKGYGANIVECEPTLEARLSVSEEVRVQTGSTMIPPFDHPHIIAGQGTCAFEFLEQASSIDVLVAPIGGGGLMSGTCISANAYSQPITVIGAEPKGADDAYRSKQENKFVPQTNPQTVADGLRTSLGDLTWPFIRDQVDEIFCVGEERIIEVMRFFWERTKVIIEPSCAVPIAAVLDQAGNPIFAGKSVGIIITGGNVDLSKLPWD